ncbi:MAG: hypothetical protein FJZ00_05145 [Candidatus Sericytochromatia bacterium]|uniref:Uncharacterized protein n=1 Tax=Candidatus Tanganyikabacteria bacterium TaxID=2961651 RepID=A0A937X5F6_9BACT|nr:hypothetical protein [Candidatus Tanganyikabacteria bacterium]
MAERAKRAAASTGGHRLGTRARALATSYAPSPDPRGLQSKFSSFLKVYVPAGSQGTLWSLFARYTAGGRIDLARTKDLSDLLHKMQQNLTAHQTTQDARYAKLMQAHRAGVQAWEKQQAAEQAKLFARADELKLSEKAREKRHELGLV